MTLHAPGSVPPPPASFPIAPGGGAIAVDLMRAFPSRTPFRLMIGEAVQFQGRTDRRDPT